MVETADEQRPRVMIVDDEENLRVSLGQILAVDFDVTLAGSGPEALRALADGARFDAVLCDLMMPRMSGVDLYEALSTVAPDAQPRFIFLTGGAYTAQAREFLARVENPRMEKPFSVAELRDALREMTGR